MDSAGSKPWTGIKTERALLVKAAGLLALSCLAAPLPARDALALPQGRNDFSVHDTDAFPPPVPDDLLPNIEARTFEVRVVKKSESGHSFLLEDPGAAKPVVGRILLLKRDAEPMLAVRVLRTFPQERQFIARRVMRYANHQSLAEGDSLTGIERVTEVGLPADSTYSTEEQNDVQELEEGIRANSYQREANGFSRGDFFRSDELPPQLKKAEEERLKEDSAGATTSPEHAAERQLSGEPLPETEDFDPELDSGTSPPPGSKASEGEGAGSDSSPRGAKRSWQEDEDSSRSTLSLEEVELIDPHRNAVSFQVGLLRNLNAEEQSAFYSGIGLRYGITLGRMLLLGQPRLQDSLTLEAGGFLYRINGYAQQDDSFTVMPLVGTLRYTVTPSDTFGFYFYGGLIKNLVTAATGPEPSDPNVLSPSEAALVLGRSSVAAGGGLLFRFGPGWELRADIGTDMIATGLMIRF